MRPKTAENSRMLEAIAQSFDEGFRVRAAEPPFAAASAPVQARRELLGPPAVWRCARRAAARVGLPHAIADLGVRVRAVESSDALRRSSSTVVDASAPCAVIASAIAAWARDEGPCTVRVGPRSAAWLDVARAALSMLIDAGEIVIENAPAEEASPPARCRVVIAPYYYAPADLDRIAQMLALELAVPSPEAEGGLDVLVARGWDQRSIFEQRFAAARAGRGEPPMELDADDAPTLLEAARHVPPGAAALSVFLYPMLRERPEVVQELDRLVSGFELAVINHTPAVRWATGFGASATPLVIDVDQRMRGATSARALRARTRFEQSPTLLGGARAAGSSWLGV